MKKIKLHKWSALVLVSLTIITGCNKRSFPSDNASQDEKYETAAYTPPAVITIPDEKAKTNKEGELYYDDANGYRYWRYCDGKYYLDRKYETATATKKKNSNRKKARSNTGNTGADVYATNR